MIQAAAADGIGACFPALQQAVDDWRRLRMGAAGLLSCCLLLVVWRSAQATPILQLRRHGSPVRAAAHLVAGESRSWAARLGGAGNRPTATFGGPR